jgi:hypothetical protein
MGLHYSAAPDSLISAQLPWCRIRIAGGGYGSCTGINPHLREVSTPQGVDVLSAPALVLALATYCALSRQYCRYSS